MTNNKNNIWHITDDPSGSKNRSHRANKFKVLDGIFDTDEEIKSTFINILLKLSFDQNSKKILLTKEQVLAIIAKAKERGGITNQANSSGNYITPTGTVGEISGVSEENAKKFSADFQRECFECGIYSGRQGGKNVGLRTTFIPDDVVKIFEELTEEEYGKMALAPTLALNQIKCNSSNLI